MRRPYRERKHRRRKFLSSTANAFWTLVMTVITVAILAVCARACASYFKLVDQEIEHAQSIE